MVTDPPYNVDITGKTKDALKIQNDNMADDDFKSLLLGFMECAVSVMREGASFYIWHASRTQTDFEEAINKCGLEVRQQIIWNKNTLVLGRQDYQWKHEPCFYGWKEGAAHYFVDDRTQTTVWDFDKPSRNAYHPTMKPIELMGKCVINSSKKGDVVIDPFLGSGSTLLACERTGSVCRGVELDPHYCDVIIARWEDETGEKAVLLPRE